MSNAGKGFFVLVVIVFVIAFACNGLYDMVRPHMIDPSKESIQMVQPNGWNPNYDQKYAEHVNLPNSQANDYNSNANLKNAQATQVVSQTRDYQAQQSNGDMTLGAMVGCVGGLALFLLFASFLLGLASKLTGG